ncbi:MAG: DUF1565 domain-containing protein, partial [Methanosphaera sp.]|nr:DUF1565 domain-containing protein [Methanosphaera sp.]
MKVDNDININTNDNIENKNNIHQDNQKEDSTHYTDNATIQNTDNTNTAVQIVNSESNLKTATANKVIYVSLKGSDNNSGTKNSPLKSIKNALKIAKNYDTIYVLSGTYYEHGILIDKNITIMGENPKTTIINAQNRHLFTIATRARVSIKTITLKNAFDENGGAIYNKG